MSSRRPQILSVQTTEGDYILTGGTWFLRGPVPAEDEQRKCIKIFQISECLMVECKLY